MQITVFSNRRLRSGVEAVPTMTAKTVPMIVTAVRRISSSLPVYAIYIVTGVANRKYTAKPKTLVTICARSREIGDADLKCF